MLCCVLWILGAAAFQGSTSSMCVASIVYLFEMRFKGSCQTEDEKM